MVATLQFQRDVLADEFALPVSAVGTFDPLVVDGQLSSLSATVGHSLFTNCVAHPPVIYVIVATEYLQYHEVRDFVV